MKSKMAKMPTLMKRSFLMGNHEKLAATTKKNNKTPKISNPEKVAANHAAGTAIEAIKKVIKDKKVRTVIQKIHGCHNQPDSNQRETDR